MHNSFLKNLFFLFIRNNLKKVIVIYQKPGDLENEVHYIL